MKTKTKIKTKTIIFTTIHHFSSEKLLWPKSYSPTQIFTYTQSFALSLTHSFIHWFTCSFTHLLGHTNIFKTTFYLEQKHSLILLLLLFHLLLLLFLFSYFVARLLCETFLLLLLLVVVVVVTFAGLVVEF